MAIERRERKTLLGNHTAKFVVTVASDQIVAGDLDRLEKRQQLLRILSDQPELLICGGAQPSKIEIQLQADRWVATMVTLVPEVAR